MSIKAMTLVWENFPRGGSDMLVALALADWCNDAGLSLHPSIHAIAEKCRLSDWQARRIVHQMIDSGLLEVVGNEFGGAPGMSRQYRFRLDILTAGADATPSADASPTPSMGATPGVRARAGTHARDDWHPCTQTPSMGASLTIIEPPIDVSTEAATLSSPSRGKKRSSLARIKKLLPEDFDISTEVRAWAQKRGYADLEAHLESFISKAQANGYRYVDWDAAFKNAIRDDWARLRNGRRTISSDDRFEGAL